MVPGTVSPSSCAVSRQSMCGYVRNTSVQTPCCEVLAKQIIYRVSRTLTPGFHQVHLHMVYFRPPCGPTSHREFFRSIASSLCWLWFLYFYIGWGGNVVQLCLFCLSSYLMFLFPTLCCSLPSSHEWNLSKICCCVWLKMHSSGYSNYNTFSLENYK